ncbi:hypothetical protein [Clostridium senegalense]|uniref:Uncharacterized protein n=1 Tax=Clostridium senegalense TaxID=1465809 RepID=A0A6M0H7K6_9CLOT|nr:hypothetical protein [Clostridium senegalense]NEU06609.1 hypothetical protein [Clostridium senegalense]
MFRYFAKTKVLGPTSSTIVEKQKSIKASKLQHNKIAQNASVPLVMVLEVWIITLNRLITKTKILGTGFNLLVVECKTRRASSVSEENKLIVPVPFEMEPRP